MNTYWLIECPDYDSLFGRSHIAWLGLQSRGTPTESVHYHDVWVDDVHKAVRFCTKESAETVLSMLLLSPGNLVATEHEDAAHPAAQEQKPVALIADKMFAEVSRLAKNGLPMLVRSDLVDAWASELKQTAVASPIPASGWVIPEGWMRDSKQVEELATHLESIGWQPDSRGDAECADQGAAMAAEVMRKVLLPMLAAPKVTE